MGLLGQIVMIIALALAGYGVFTKLHLPAATNLGAMVAVGAYQIFHGGLPALPALLIYLIQIIIGLSIGAKINHQNIHDIKKIWGPSLVIAVYTLASTAAMAMLINRFTPDFYTALFSAAPGGITEMAVLAMSYQAEIAIISTFQFVRLLVVLSVIPLLARLAHGPKEAAGGEKERPGEEQTNVSFGRLRLYAAGVLGGLLLIAVGFPGGGIIGAMAALGGANIFFQESYVFPSKVKKIALLGVGITIGLEFSPLMVSKIQEMLLPITGFSLIIVLGNLLIGWLIRHFTRWDTVTCLLGSSPGGLSQMLAVGEEMRADTLKISILQLVRVLTIVTCIPVAAALL